MRLLYISSNRSWGGSELLWFKSARELARKNDIEIMVVVPDHRSFFSKISSQDEIDNYAFYPIAFHLSKNKWMARINRRLLKPLLRKQLLKRIRSFQPDLILINQGNIYQFRSEMPELFNFVRAGKTTYKVLTHLGAGYLTSEKELEEQQQFLVRAKNCYFVSEATAKYVQTCLQLSLLNSNIVRNPVHLEKPTYLTYPAIQDVVHFATVASLSERKGQDILLEVLAGDVWQKRNWVLNLYGTGDFKDVLKRLVKFFGLEDRVRFHGHVNDITSVWLENHIHILPSLHESAPISIVEAMVCGRPNLINDLGGPKEFVNKSNGYVSKGTNAESLAEVMELAWNDRENWNNKGIKANKMAIQWLKEAESFNDLLVKSDM